MKRYALGMSVLVLACGMAGPVVAQETEGTSADTRVAPEPRREHRPAIELVRVQLVLVRYQGEKKVASTPYTVLAATDRSKAQLRMGVEVPIAVASGGTTSFQYRNVGTSIDCRVQAPSGNLYPVELSVENSSIYRRADDGSPAQDPVIAQERPMFRSFNVSLSLVLRDGQTLQTVASTDSVTGEVVKIDVTLNVVK